MIKLNKRWLVRIVLIGVAAELEGGYIIIIFLRGETTWICQ
jgi:hypothetical protein